MTRRKARENAFIALFAFSFIGDMEEVIRQAHEEESDYSLDEYGEGLLRLYLRYEQEVGDAIEAHLKGWKAERLSRVNLALLRLAATEMRHGEKDMDSVVINEAVELAKKYGGETDYQFVNGLLGSLARGAQGQAQQDAEMPPAGAPRQG